MKVVVPYSRGSISPEGSPSAVMMWTGSEDDIAAGEAN